MASIKNIIIGIIIAVVLLLFFVYGTKLLYNAPLYENYCNVSLINMPEKIPSTTCAQDSIVNQKVQDCYNKKGTPYPVYDTRGCQSDVTCSMCNLDFEKANEAYSKNLFIISVIISVIAIAIAAFFFSVEAVSGGLMFGSLMFLIYGTGNYWRYMNDWLRFIILGIALIVLIYIGYKIANKESKKK